MNIIDLKDYCTRIGGKVAKVFTGRDRGKTVREASRIDELYQEGGEIKVIIPLGTFSITPSFLEELFTNIVKEYGIEKFRDTVHIEPNGYNIEVPLEEALDRILLNKNASHHLRRVGGDRGRMEADRRECQLLRRRFFSFHRSRT